jgi:cyclophilin family peptidyl-prolyl cis-trans isomerase
MKKFQIICTVFSLFCFTLNAQNNTKNTEQIVLIQTDLGDIKVKLYNSTPKHRDNFIKLVNEKFYDSLLFHRVIPTFMIQGGDPLSKNAPPGEPLGNGDVGYTIPAEFVDTLFHKRGALCAARTANPEKASSGCQFYIVHGQVYLPEQLQLFESQRRLSLNEKQKEIYTTIGGTPQLDRNYTVFGEVTEGMDVVEKIATVETKRERPLTDIHMKMSLVK